MIFTTELTDVIDAQKKVAVIHSHGKMDTMHLEAAIKGGAKKVFMICADLEKAWKTFNEQYEFVQAAGGLVINKENKILFIYRLEKWDLPKGKVEDGETIAEGAMREVSEECGIEGLKLIRTLCTTWHTYLQKGDPILKSTVWYLMHYFGDATPIPQAFEGITEARWLSMDELEIVTANTFPSVMDVVSAFQIEQ